MKKPLARFAVLACLLLTIQTAFRTAWAQPSALAAPQGIAHCLQPYVDSHTLAGAVTLVASPEKVLSLEAVGHIAIVRPSTKSEATIQAEGPQVIQAGLENHASTSLKEGFKHHRAAFREGQIRYFAHPLPAK